MSNIIEAKSLSKRYLLGQNLPYLSLRDSIAERIAPKNFVKHKEDKRFWALKNVSFNLKRGEVLGIIGPNGAGKSTLLKILSRITPPTKGRATINGRVASLLEVGTGFHPELTGRENIYLNGAILGMNRQEIENNFAKIVDFSGVQRFLDTPVKRYSSGMHVRLAFSIAAYLQPEILLIDEVLSVGDYEFQRKSLGKMEDISRSGNRTIIFVSHNMNSIRNLCDRVLLLDKGETSALGKADQIIGEYIKLSKKQDETPLVKRKDRKGSGLNKIKAIDIGNIHDEPHLRSYDRMKIRIHTNKELSKFSTYRLVLGFYDENSMPLFRIDTGTKKPTKKTSARLEITTAPVNLVPSSGYINSMLYIDGAQADYVVRAKNFVIVGNKKVRMPTYSKKEATILVDYKIIDK